jgi:DNA-binding transcriptional MerR regulator
MTRPRARQAGRPRPSSVDRAASQTAGVVLDGHGSMMHPVATTGSRGLWVRAIADSRAEHFPIGELSRLTGVNIETIRYYERIKMLPAPPRTTSGRRVYGPSDLRVVAFIRRSRELGFSLGEIRALLRLGVPRLAERSRTSPLIICKMSGQRFPTLQSSNAFWRKQLPGVRATESQIAPSWIFSISNATGRRCQRAVGLAQRRHHGVAAPS